MTKILVVDDNELNLELTREVLELGGFEVATEDNGLAGFERAKRMQPDLILMDMRMPGISGVEALHALRAEPTTAHIPVVVLTASVMKGDETRLLSEGFDTYMSKPINSLSFADEVRELLATLRPR